MSTQSPVDDRSTRGQVWKNFGYELAQPHRLGAFPSYKKLPIDKFVDKAFEEVLHAEPREALALIDDIAIAIAVGRPRYEAWEEHFKRQIHELLNRYARSSENTDNRSLLEKCFQRLLLQLARDSSEISQTNKSRTFWSKRRLKKAQRIFVEEILDKIGTDLASRSDTNFESLAVMLAVNYSAIMSKDQRWKFVRGMREHRDVYYDPFITDTIMWIDQRKFA